MFEDDRKSDPSHAFNNPAYAGASILVVNSNFGCGSSREHAPQGLVRYGIKAVIAESYSEIFLGNSSVLGLPCFTADKASIAALQTWLEQHPESVVDATVTEEPTVTSDIEPLTVLVTATPLGTATVTEPARVFTVMLVADTAVTVPTTPRPPKPPPKPPGAPP